MQEHIITVGEKKFKILFSSEMTGFLRPYEFKSKFVPQQSSEFISDIDFQTNVLTAIYYKNHDISIADLQHSLSKACDKHISKYGRLCDSDLYSLTDCSVYILAGMGFQDKEQIIDIYRKLVKIMINKYQDHMYEATQFGPVKMF